MPTLFRKHWTSSGFQTNVPSYTDDASDVSSCGSGRTTVLYVYGPGLPVDMMYYIHECSALHLHRFSKTCPDHSLLLTYRVWPLLLSRERISEISAADKGTPAQGGASVLILRNLFHFYLGRGWDELTEQSIAKCQTFRRSGIIIRGLIVPRIMRKNWRES
jgi:hypothetical protein